MGLRCVLIGQTPPPPLHAFARNFKTPSPLPAACVLSTRPPVKKHELSTWSPRIGDVLRHCQSGKQVLILTNFAGKQRLVVKLVLCPRHQIVDVFGCWAFDRSLHGLSVCPVILVFGSWKYVTQHIWYANICALISIFVSAFVQLKYHHLDTYVSFWSD